MTSNKRCKIDKTKTTTIETEVCYKMMEEVLVQHQKSGTGHQDVTSSGGSIPRGIQWTNCCLLILRANRFLTTIIEQVRGKEILDVKF